MNSIMKEGIIIFCLFLLPFAFVYPQAEVKSDCETYLEDIFKVNGLMNKYGTIEYIYTHKERVFFKNASFESDSFLNSFFQLIRGFPYREDLKDSIPKGKPGELVRVEFMPKEEMNEYLEQLNYTPQEAYKAYKEYIRNIKLEKEKYLTCIEVELAKGDESEYAKRRLFYDFKDPRSSLMVWISELEFLRVFDEFILNDDNEVLPDFLRVMTYLECDCKIPSFEKFLRRYKLEKFK